MRDVCDREYRIKKDDLVLGSSLGGKGCLPVIRLHKHAILHCEQLKQEEFL